MRRRWSSCLAHCGTALVCAFLALCRPWVHVMVRATLYLLTWRYARAESKRSDCIVFNVLFSVSLLSREADNVQCESPVRQGIFHLGVLQCKATHLHLQYGKILHYYNHTTKRQRCIHCQVSETKSMQANQVTGKDVNPASV